MIASFIWLVFPFLPARQTAGEQGFAVMRSAGRYVDALVRASEAMGYARLVPG